MKNLLIKKIVSGEVVPSIGKYTKDGQDLDYVFTIPAFDPMTGAPIAPTSESMSRTWIENAIASYEEELNNLQQLLVMLGGEGVTVIADYSGQ